MSSDVTSWVEKRLDADDTLADEAQLLVLAALEGRAALADMASFTPPTPEPTADEAPEPVGAFLKQITVEGFRGIGPEARLHLDPMPSLTVISGRNGSGKSSFAEALEVALTGSTYRWKKRASQWQEQWRNIHDGHPARITVTLAEEGVGETRVGIEWAQDGQLDDRTVWVQRQGQRREAGVSSLGWDGPLETYRPLLTYEELGSVLTSGPSYLYDALSPVLGLEQLADALASLGDHHKAISAPAGELAKSKKTLRAELGELADERASEALAMLEKRVTDTESLRSLAVGSGVVDQSGAQGRALLMLTLPSVDDTRAAADELRAATEQLAATAGHVGEALQRRSRLIEAALDLHHHAGDQPCPVCATGTLDAARVASLRQELEQDQSILNELLQAKRRHDAALRAAQSLIHAAPAALDSAPEALAGLVAPLVQRWQAWANAPCEPLELADHLVDRGEAVREALGVVQEAASRHVSEVDEAWGRVASQLARFADDAEAVALAADGVAHADAALRWLKRADIDLKNERIEPISQAAGHIWEQLRRESNVTLSGITLAGTATRRRVDIGAAVDGADAGALAVMSQGELHSLALALFLPRATMAESPFRFVVLDDPVQAMDPTKVDGLVEALLEIAKTRQVIVFSHDDRFATAVRRAPKDVPVKVLEVTRGANSVVESAITHNPAKRFLDDAFALTMDGGLPEDLLLRVLPGMLRIALEAQAREIFYTREISTGRSPLEVEATWNGATTTRASLALALKDPDRVGGWLLYRPWRSNAIAVSRSLHDKLHLPPIDACRDVERTLKDLQAEAAS